MGVDEEDRTLVWLGSTRDELAAAPTGVRSTFGFALRLAQQGEKSDIARPMKGPLREVTEVRDIDESGAYRLMYCARIGERIYVLDVFQKKSHTSTATPKHILDRIELRLKIAKEIEKKEQQLERARRRDQ